MKKLLLLSILPAVLAIFCIGCEKDDTKIQQMEVSLPKLTSAMVGLVMFPDSTNVIPENELISKAFEGKKAMQQAFVGYEIKIWHDSSNVVVLVCSPDSKYALLEDGSWTSQFVDREWYKTNPPAPAQITLKPAYLGSQP